MKLIFSICLIICLALSVNSLRVRTHAHAHAQSRSTTSQGWDSCTRDVLIGSGHLSEAAITGLDGNVRGATALHLEPGEGAAIANLFKNPENAFASGVTVSGVE